MIRLGGTIGYQVLRLMFPRKPAASTQTGRADHLVSYHDRLQSLLSEEELESLKSSSVADFGCGTGEGVIELAESGFHSLVGIDIRESVLQIGRKHAEDRGLSSRCRFVKNLENGSADAILSIDAFEHFEDPGTILECMSQMLAHDGKVIASFGPTWYHPRGGHLFSMFPWAHLVFSEKALCRWRRDFKEDDAHRFNEVDGGLNGMTIAGFEKCVAESPFRIEKIKLRPIHPIRAFHNRFTREFLTSIVECILVKKK